MSVYNVPRDLRSPLSILSLAGRLAGVRDRAGRDRIPPLHMISPLPPGEGRGVRENPGDVPAHGVCSAAARFIAPDASVGQAFLPASSCLSSRRGAACCAPCCRGAPPAPAQLSLAKSAERRIGAPLAAPNVSVGRTFLSASLYTTPAFRRHSRILAS